MPRPLNQRMRLNVNWPLVYLIVLCVALAGHYVSQKMLLARGWKAEDTKPYIKRFIMNGGLLMVIAIIALTKAVPPYGLFGILFFFEAAVCFAFARKLSKK